MSLDLHAAAAATKTALRRALDWTLLRKPLRPDDLVLSAEALVWLSRMPVPVRPLLLSRRYPRIVNTLAANWTNQSRTCSYFETLLTDTRGGRIGFPVEVTEELVELRAYYVEVLVPANSTEAWDDPYMF